MNRIRPLLLSLLPILILISVPWYRDTNSEPRFSLQAGIPDWVTVAIVCYLLHAIISACIWVFFPPADNSTINHKKEN